MDRSEDQAEELCVERCFDRLLSGHSGQEVEIAGRRLVLEEVIGRGGQGVVFSAVERETNARFAVKLLWRDDRQTLARFRREANLADWSHPNIVRVFGSHADEKGAWLLMELVEKGVSLRAVIANGASPLEHVAAWGRDVAVAMAFAHSQGVVHRDIKPSNILIEQGGENEPGTARLADFGLAYVRDATPLSGDQTPGTLLYMAPEQATRGEFSERSDIFSLGAVIFEALTGVRLLGCGQDPVSAAEKLPEGMAQIVGHAIQIDPSRRYASAQWMAEDLEAVLQGEPPRHAPPLAGLAEAGPVPSSRARMTWSQRGGGIGSVIAVAAAIVAIVAAAWPRLGPLAETGRATVSAHTDSRSQSPLVSRAPVAHQTSPQPTARTDGSQVRPYLRHLTTGKELPYGLNLTWNEDLWSRSNEISMGLLSTSLIGSPGVTAAMADCRPKQRAVLFEHEGGSGGVLEVRVPQNLGVLPADVRDKVSEVHLQGHDLWVILYEQEHFQGLGLVVNSGRQAGRVVKLAAVDFNDQPRSIRTINRPRHWHEVLALREFAEDEGRYDLRATTHAEAFADWVRESIALGNARECRWEQLEVDLKQRRITGRLFIRHRHRPGGILGDQHVYSWTQRLVFEVDLQDLDETIPKVTMRLLGKGISIDASEVIQRLLQAGIIPVAGSERLWDWPLTLAL